MSTVLGQPTTVADATTVPRPAAAKRTSRRLRVTPAGVFSLLVIALLYVGIRMPTERYITPKSGVGYALGIIGGSLMLLLFLYSARKRFKWLRFLGPTSGLFRYHMLLGILGPLCILYHANFGFGAANSNVALLSMLIVAGSGLVGRYIYAHIHHGLYGSKLTLGELQKNAEALRASSATFGVLPDLLPRLGACEKAILATGPRVPILAMVKVFFVGLTVWRTRLGLHAYIRRCLREAATQSAAVAKERKRLRRAAFAYVDQRLIATRRVAGFQAYERLFSLWHALHLPLIFILIVAGVVHVIAVNLY